MCLLLSQTSTGHPLSPLGLSVTEAVVVCWGCGSGAGVGFGFGFGAGGGGGTGGGAGRGHRPGNRGQMGKEGLGGAGFGQSHEKLHFSSLSDSLLWLL